MKNRKSINKTNKAKNIISQKKKAHDTKFQKDEKIQKVKTEKENREDISKSISLPPKREGASIEVAVIGGGAAGMMAAIVAARRGKSVAILEGNPQLGKKLAQTGNGRCNYTNLDMKAIYYRSENETFPEKVLSQFSEKDAIDFFQTLGIYPKYRGNYVYPSADQAKSFVSAMEYELGRLGCKVYLENELRKLQYLGGNGKADRASMQDRKRFYLETDQSGIYADTVIVATGSKASIPKTKERDIYALIKALGHSIIPIVPSLTGLQCKEKIYRDIAGVRVEARLRLYIEDRLQYEELGELQLADYGISGIPVFQFSRYAAYGLLQKKSVKVRINFMPGFDRQSMYAYLETRRKALGYRLAPDFLDGFLNSKLARALLMRTLKDTGKKSIEITDEELSHLASEITEFETKVLAVNPLSKAQCAAGGVDTREIDSCTMESKRIAGLYFAGEILDVDGICGGYNLQFAWSSGYIAGRGV